MPVTDPTVIYRVPVSGSGKSWARILGEWVQKQSEECDPNYLDSFLSKCAASSKHLTYIDCSEHWDAGKGEPWIKVLEQEYVADKERDEPTAVFHSTFARMPSLLIYILVEKIVDLMTNRRSKKTCLVVSLHFLICAMTSGYVLSSRTEYPILWCFVPPSSFFPSAEAFSQYDGLPR